jgi:site-specific DNA recombinase
MTRAIAYLRMSREKADDGDWKKRQLEDSRAIADRKGATLADDDILIDTVSASKFSRKERTGYLELLRQIEAGGVDIVICWMEDRAHRQILELAEFIDLCRKHNVLPITPAAEYDLDDPDQVSMWFIKVRFAEAEVEKTSKRLRRQRQQAAENGKQHHGGNRAFGTTGRGRNKVPLVRALAEQEMIKEAADRIIAGDTLRGICVDWNKRKIPSARNATWNATILRRTLLSPRIAGYRDHKGTLYEAKEWQPIIPRDQWQAICAILTDPTRTTAIGGGQAKHLLSGLIVCGVCGRKMYCRTPATKTGVRAYYCPDRDGSGGHVHRNAAKIEVLIEKGLFAEAESNHRYDEAAKSVADDDPSRPIMERMTLNRARLDGLPAREDEALELELDGKDDQAKRLRASIARSRVRYEAELERDHEVYARMQGDRVIAYLPRNLRQAWPDFSLGRKRAILAALFRGKKIVVHPQRQAHGPRFDPDAVQVVPIHEMPA